MAQTALPEQTLHPFLFANVPDMCSLTYDIYPYFPNVILDYDLISVDVDPSVLIKENMVITAYNTLGTKAEQPLYIEVCEDHITLTQNYSIELVYNKSSGE